MYLKEGSNAREDWLKVYGRTNGTSVKMQQRRPEISVCKEALYWFDFEYGVFLHGSFRARGERISRVSVGSVAA